MTSRAKPRFTSRRSNSQPTNQDNQSTDTVLQKWAGDQLSRTTWVNMMLKKAAQVFVWKQLVTSGTVPIQRSGQTAVFSANHGVEHFNGHNKGSWRTALLNALVNNSRFTPRAQRPRRSRMVDTHPDRHPPPQHRHRHRHAARWMPLASTRACTSAHQTQSRPRTSNF